MTEHIEIGFLVKARDTKEVFKVVEITVVPETTKIWLQNEDGELWTIETPAFWSKCIVNGPFCGMPYDVLESIRPKILFEEDQKEDPSGLAWEWEQSRDLHPGRVY